MVIFKTAADLQAFLHRTHRPIGFIPTMGALHQGHLSLIQAAHHDDLLSVCSIFVNPTQFNDPEDFEKYPRNTEADIALLLQADCEVLFLPSQEEIYPQGPEAARSYDFGELETVLEGAQRPGHFHGVGQVVSRLLEIVNPKRLYLGQKDFQQCLIIRKLISLMKKDDEIELKIAATVREPDGLALSSRNRRLTEPQRALAAIIYQCLVSIASKAATGKWAILQKECMELLRAKGLEPEYVALANAENLHLLPEFSATEPMVALIAARLGKVRLIDNMLLA